MHVTWLSPNRLWLTVSEVHTRKTICDLPVLAGKGRKRNGMPLNVVIVTKAGYPEPVEAARE